ncbi:MAG: hypothetical protein QOE46_2410 [Acidobacteriota bacterium]|jgi:hypothetical protein|nr:hypothetical protein [Acidobacteriota bacterium]
MAPRAASAHEQEHRDACEAEGDDDGCPPAPRESYDQRQQEDHRPRRGEGEEACEQYGGDSLGTFHRCLMVWGAVGAQSFFKPAAILA